MALHLTSATTPRHYRHHPTPITYPTHSFIPSTTSSESTTSWTRHEPYCRSPTNIYELHILIINTTSSTSLIQPLHTTKFNIQLIQIQNNATKKTLRTKEQASIFTIYICYQQKRKLDTTTTPISRYELRLHNKKLQQPLRNHDQPSSEITQANSEATA